MTAVGVHAWLDVKKHKILLNSKTNAVQGLVQKKEPRKKEDGGDGRAKKARKRPKQDPKAAEAKTSGAMDNSAKFLHLFEQAIIEAKEQNAGKRIVAVVDGSQVHTKQAKDTIRPGNMTLPQLQKELEEMNLWDPKTMAVKRQKVQNTKNAQKVSSIVDALFLISKFNRHS